MNNNVFKKIFLLVIMACTLVGSVHAASTDIIKPTVEVILQGTSAVEEGGTITFKINAYDNAGISRFNISESDITLVGFTANKSISGLNLTLSNIKSTSTGKKYITVAEGVAKDLAGNTSSKVYSSAFSVTEKEEQKVTDVIKPTLTITLNSSSIKEGGKVVFNVTAADNSSIASFNLKSSNIDLVGFSGSVSITGTGTTRTITISNIKSTSTGKKYITIDAGVAKDGAGNTNSQVSSSSFSMETNVIANDIVKPTLEIELMSASVEEGKEIVFQVVASDNVAVSSFNLKSSNVELNGFTGNVSIVNISSTNRAVKITNIKSTSTGKKYITIDAGVAKDAAGNKSSQVYSSAFDIKNANNDVIKPTVEVTLKSTGSIANGGTVVFEVNVFDNIGVGALNLTVSKIQLNGFTGNVSVTGTGLKTRTITITNVKSTNDAKKYITISQGVVNDAAGNTSSQVYSSSFEIAGAIVNNDVIKPTLEVILKSSSTIQAGGTVMFEVNAYDNVSITNFDLLANHITLNGFTGNVSVTGTGLKTRTITITNVKSTNDVKKYITIAAGVAKDAAGNLTSQVYSSTFAINTPVVNKDTIRPTISISIAKPTSVYAGGTVVYEVTFTDNIAVTAVDLTAQNIMLHGFTANISVSGTGVKTRTITLTNIKGIVGADKFITVSAGVAKDAADNTSVSATSSKFTIKSVVSPVIKPEDTTTTTKVETVYGVSCIDDLSLIGDINDEITYFSSWLRAEKYTASYVQENNYTAEDERITYMVEYYNGSTAPTPDVSFRLTIPYYVEVEEINGNGKIVSRNQDETVIGWDLGKVSSKAYCRLYVRVKFTENTGLEKSSNISEVFYPQLKTIAGGNTSYSYLRQLFIDKTSGKTGSFKSYLSSLDGTNSIRPEDEITRAEFAKLLADSGLISSDYESEAYKRFSDWESIPSYARAAVSALASTDIIQAFPDGTFKANNPILMEDMLQMIAQATTHMSSSKLTIAKPTFLYKSLLKNDYNELSDKKDYIMELIRQNVLDNYGIDPDKYALRKDAVEIINALTFRGPYVEGLPSNTLKFMDISEESVYFYNIVGASNSYTYSYDYRLWQKIETIK